MQICFFSDFKSRNFNPLTLTRPLDDLRIGIFTIRQKWQSSFSSENITRIVPDYLSDVFPAGHISDSEKCLWINPRFLPSKTLLSKIQKLDINSFLSFNGDIVAALLPGKLSHEYHQQKQLSTEQLNEKVLDEAVCIEHYWDLFELNATEIQNDLFRAGLEPISATANDIIFTHKKPENIYIGQNVSIEPGVIIDATNGPVIIQKNVTLEAGCILKGPLAICEGSTIKMLARISNGTTIGPACKVAGEVSNSIFHSYSNKAHDGFVGNSVFGQWVNLGASTTTSNLKNDYGNIKITDWNTGERVDSGKQFFGTVMGDHSKTAINTSLNTGTICGVSSNIFVSGLTPSFIPSFSWMGNDSHHVFRFNKAIDVMRAVMKRRNVELTPEYEQMMNHIFENR